MIAAAHGLLWAAILAEGIRGLLEPEFEVIGGVSDGWELLDAAIKLRPDVIVADISMPSLNGIEAAVQGWRPRPTS